jgi:hypothetical protein
MQSATILCPLRRSVCAAALLALVGVACAGNDEDAQGVGFDDGRSDPSNTRTGAQCLRNSECKGSPAERSFANVRCFQETYCLQGRCYAECRDACVPARSDVDPCPGRGVCAPLGFGSAPRCTRKPVPCSSAQECPPAVPNLDAGQSIDGGWQCIDQFCQIPGFEYETR